MDLHTYQGTLFDKKVYFSLDGYQKAYLAKLLARLGISLVLHLFDQNFESFWLGQ